MTELDVTKEDVCKLIEKAEEGDPRLKVIYLMLILE